MYKLKIACQSEVEAYQKLKKNSEEVKLDSEGKCLSEDQAIEVAMNENRIVAYT
jgi:hypothetical protein